MKIESNYPQNTTPVSNRAAQPRPNAGVSASAEAVSLSTLAGTLQSGEKPRLTRPAFRKSRMLFPKGASRLTLRQ